jgi:hypothetical protein
MNTVINDLIAAIETVPRLPGAACKGRVEIFDRSIPGAAPGAKSCKHGATHSKSAATAQH